MTISKAELGQRIRAVREGRAMTQSALAGMVDGLDQTKLSRIENGERGVTSLELADFADALGVDPSDLIDEVPLQLAVAARAAVGHRSDACAAALERATTLARIRRVLADNGYPAPAAPPDARKTRGRLEIDRGKFLADTLRHDLRIGDEPLPNLAAFAEQLGLAVVIEPFGQGFDGLCVRDGDRALAVVNSSNYWHRQRFTIAHELCHHLLNDLVDGHHVDGNIFESIGDKSEMRANAFAANLLLPDVAVYSLESDRHASVLSAVRLAFDYGVSMQTLVWRLKNTGVATASVLNTLTSMSVRSLAEKAGRDADYRYNTRTARLRRAVSPQLKEAVLAASEAGVVGPGLVGELLGVDPDTVDADTPESAEAAAWAQMVDG